MLKKLFLCILCIVLLSTETAVARPDDRFFKGVSSRGEPPVKRIRDLRADSVQIVCFWGEIQPEITERDLTVDEVKKNPAIVDEFITNANWSAFDAKIKPYLDAGLNLVILFGIGFDGDLPKFEGEPANPDNLGRDNYLGHIFLFSSAVARHYRNVTKIFCLECELNEAGLAAMFGWRSPSPVNPSTLSITKSAWCDFSFTTSLLATMSDAVSREAPNVLKATSFHTDISENIDVSWLAFILERKPWTKAAAAWDQYVDVIGINSYPNYYTADPVYSDVGDKVAKIKSLLPGKLVMIFETGYPIPRRVPWQETFPDPVDWTEDKQAEYIEGAIKGAVAEGASGFFYFNVEGTGCSGAPGGYSKKDLRALSVFGPAFREGNIYTLFIRVLEFGFDYMLNRFPKILQGAEGFGVIRSDGSERPGYYVIQEWYTRKIEEMLADKSMADPELAPSDIQSTRGGEVHTALLQNYPNSFNPGTWIPYQIAKGAYVTIRIYNISGYLVRTLDLGHKPTGFYITKDKAAHWDGTNNTGEQVASGVYFYSIRAGSFTAVRKMVKVE